MGGQQDRIERMVNAQDQYVNDKIKKGLPVTKEKVDEALKERGIVQYRQTERTRQDQGLSTYVNQESRKSRRELFQPGQTDDFYRVIPEMRDTIVGIDDNAKKIKNAMSMEMLGLSDGVLDKLKYKVMRFYNKDLESPESLINGQISDINRAREQINNYKRSMEARQTDLRQKFNNKQSEIEREKEKIKRIDYNLSKDKELIDNIEQVKESAKDETERSHYAQAKYNALKEIF